MNALVRRHGGSYKAAAAAAGIPERTWRDWRSGAHPPSARNLRKLELAYQRQIVAPQVARRLLDSRRAVSDIHVQADVVGDPAKGRYTNRQPHRWFRAENIPAQEVVSAWMYHGAPAAVARFEHLLRIEYGIPFAMEGNQVAVELLPSYP